jgi:CheY-like chemotaxis protein
VLVVDSSEALLAAARRALAASMHILTATGAEAIERWKAARPGIVVVEVGDAGSEALGQLREMGKSALVGVAKDRGTQEAARKAGCHAVVGAPCEPTDLLDQVLVAAAAVATIEEQVEALLGEQDGCTVLNLPNPRSKAFGKMMPVLTKQLKALAAGGRTKLVVDMDNVPEPNADVVKSVVSLVSDAVDAGLKTAIAASSASLVESLKQIAETQNRLFPSRDAAREGLK